ncbi:RNA polymerase sigma factor [Actinomadura chibensis]|uniref:RNA polymerase sigma factor n=1 Tax=Actinomadura chibensis TaxID=392828 RepID=A0A5D0NCL2_9ACTN|nr:RNA polymerase sigma factor [Actinomadura chibensis]TYB42029.1 RNA polymerase sigma factor [Actinomadura chibensis]
MSETSPAGADDAVVIERSRRHPEVFAEVFRRHAPDVKRYATRRLGWDAAEDVVAETFLAAFRQRDRYDLARRDARPWLFGIATNLIGRHVRAEVRQLRAVERGGGDPVAEPFTDRCDERVSAQAQGRRLAGALAALPEGHRDALLLVAWGGLTYPEAAAALGVRVGTVRSRISRARGRLRRELGGVDPAVFVKEETVHG